VGNNWQKGLIQNDVKFFLACSIPFYADAITLKLIKIIACPIYINPIIRVTQ
jgi:hypothetical protein